MAQRANAHIRLTILLGLLVAQMLTRDGAIIVLFLTVVCVLHQGLQSEVRKELYWNQEKRRRMGDDPSRTLQYYPPNTTARGAQVNTPQVDTQVNTPQVDTSVWSGEEHNSAKLVRLDQQQYSLDNHRLSRQPTRFDMQNQLLTIGGAAPPLSTRFNPQADFGRHHPNPGPFDFGTAIYSTNPRAYTFETNVIERMMRAPDEVDPGLVTNPIPDPTFSARMPLFDKSHEYEAEQRWRMQYGSGMRFW